MERVLEFMNISIKHSVLAATLFCFMLPQSNAVKADSFSDPAVTTGVLANSCGNLALFAFPVSPKQGDLVTVFVSVTNNIAADASFVVETTLSTGKLVVSQDDRVVHVPAHSSVTYQIAFATSPANGSGSYSVFSESYQGDSLPACGKCFCSFAYSGFDLACNSNQCGPVE